MASTSFSLAQRLKAGETVHIGWATLGIPIMAETLARAGFSVVNLDQQHGQFDTNTVIDGIAAVQAAGATPSVRIPLGGFALASRALDFGAEAIIAPMINTVEDAKALASATKYPPIGERSWGPGRALMTSGMSMQDYLGRANDGTMIFAMIETRTALANIDAILSVPGIDGVFVGPSDLSIALSNGALLDPNGKAGDEACEKIVAAARKAGKVAGAFTGSVARANDQAARGFHFIAVSSDGGMLHAGAAAALKELKT